MPTRALWRQDRRLTASASVIFGSWRAALAAAGIQSVRQRLSREQVIEGLRDCRRNNRAIGAPLYAAAKRHFGSIDQAYAAAGVRSRRPPGVRPQRNWTPEQAITSIRERHQAGKSLSATHREDPVLYAVAKRLHGTWTGALAAAGLLPPPRTVLSEAEVLGRIRQRHRRGEPLIRRRWSKRAVVEGIRARQRRGEALSRTWREDKSLFRAAVGHFGNWASAMRAAGLQAIPRERWSQARVLERLRVWYDRCGGGNLRAVDPNLAAAAGRLFGSYHAALAAAGLEPPCRFWTEDRVVAAIQDRYIAGGPPHIEGLGDLRLSLAAKRRFGSWRAAVEAAGLAGKIPIKKPLRRWTPPEVIAEIRKAHRPGRKLAELSRSNQSL